MEIGFTGTRLGVTLKQFDELVDTIEFIMDQNDVTMAHHGDCIGADATFHDVCESLGIPITIHPPIKSTTRAFKKNETVMMPQDSYIQRDRKIVKASDFMLSCPHTMVEITRSGTWTTTRFARKTNTPVHVIWPKYRKGER